MTTLNHPDGSVHIEEINGRRAVSVEPREGIFTPTKQWITNYSRDLIEHVLRVKGPARLCDELMRDENPLYVEHHFRWNIMSYLGNRDFADQRVLDFGSGCGASSMILARLMPKAEIVGVELEPLFMELAQHRARFSGVQNRVSFYLSPDPNQLPPEIGSFDYIVLSAVWEHLLPDERRSLLALLWSHLKDGGIMLIDQTPYRWFPIEMHTTGLPLLNYLPDRLAHYCARLSKRVKANESWSDLLRRGIRGGTRAEIMAILRERRCRARLVEPSHTGVTDRIDLWYRLSASTRNRLLKRVMVCAFRAIKMMTGAEMTPSLSLAIRRVPS
jgi:2-polyprenyl-3-methyl-5-hydroxy-6-metoxy-1,4-benzoquinol methylase